MADRKTVRLMGNCARCYYYTPNLQKNSDEGVCHRYPKPLDKGAGNYCGEYVDEERLARRMDLKEAWI